MPSPGQQIITELINSFGAIVASVISTFLNSLYGSLLTAVWEAIGLS